MLTDKQIIDNKIRFLDLIQSIDREGIRKELLLKQLEASDFFDAPASSVPTYHGCYRGGLCQHSLNVYDTLKKLLSGMEIGNYDENTIKIVALLHDLSKMNYYEKDWKNVKVYSDAGKKSDERGKFDWVAQEFYRVSDKPTVVLGSHGENSMYMANAFIPLTMEEASAIINHMGFSEADQFSKSVSQSFKRYPLALYLHIADLISANDPSEFTVE